MESHHFYTIEVCGRLYVVQDKERVISRNRRDMSKIILLLIMQVRAHFYKSKRSLKKEYLLNNNLIYYFSLRNRLKNILLEI